MSLERLLPAGSGRRRAALLVAVVAAALVVTQLVMPGRGGGRGTPGAILFQGLVEGAVTAVIATGLVVVYRALRVVNFAQTALGVGGATLTFEFVQFTDVPFPIALVLGLVLSTGVGFLFGLILLRYRRAPRLVLTVFTIVLAGVLAFLIRPGIQRLPFFPDMDLRTLGEQVGSEPIREFLPFAGWEFDVGSLPLSFGFAHVFALEMAALAILAVAAFLRFTRAGVAVRAMAENSERASLLGVGTGLFSAVVWAMAGLLSGVGVLLIGMLSTPGTAAGFAPTVLLPGLAAAVVGRMSNIPVTVVAALAIAVLTNAAEWSYQDDTALIDAGLFVVLAGALLVQRRRATRFSSAEEASSWQATEEHRPIPTELRGVTSVRLARFALPVLGLAFVAVYPFVFSIRAINLGSVIALFAIIGVSIVVLTGWAGQVSLGQVAFAGIGAVVGGALTADAGIPFWFAVPMAAAVTAVIAALVGLPALRVPGLLLLVVTFAFAIAVRSVLFDERYMGWLLPGSIERPDLFFLDFADERSMYFLSVGCLVLAIVVATNLRRSRFGRMVIAARENEANLRSFGIPAVRAKLLAFAVAGGMAGFAGAVFAHHQGGINGDSFGAEASIALFIATVFGGVGSITGALAGVIYFQAIAYFFTNAIFRDIVTSGVTLYVLFAVPGGVAAILYRLRDAWLRVVAQRHRIVVPSLFADYDPEAAERQLVPLAEPAASSGPARRRFSLPSVLYGDRAGLRGSVLRTRDEAAVSAAARHVIELDEDAQEART